MFIIDYIRCSYLYNVISTKVFDFSTSTLKTFGTIIFQFCCIHRFVKRNRVGSTSFKINAQIQTLENDEQKSDSDHGTRENVCYPSLTDEIEVYIGRFEVGDECGKVNIAIITSLSQHPIYHDM